VPLFKELAKLNWLVFSYETSTGKLTSFSKFQEPITQYQRSHWVILFKVFLGRFKNQKLYVVSGNIGIRTTLWNFCSKFLDYRIIIWCRLTMWTETDINWLRKRLRRWNIPRADVCFVNGESGAKYCELFGAKRIVKIFQSSVSRGNLVSSKKQFDRWESGPIVFVGRLIRSKGLENFFSVYSEIDNSLKRKILVIGDGEERKRLTLSAFEKGLDVEFMGWAERSEILRILESSFGLLFPTLKDEWGLVVIEALSRGTPILGSTTSGAIEELTQGYDLGSVFEVLNTNSVKGKTLKFLSLTYQEWSILSKGNYEKFQSMNLTQQGMAFEINESLDLQQNPK
jgi:glycosyltransferase involved in cell wall biosynthesis